jgi:exopolysaccharide biosynthesis WecB/TagA/CpsF family protein
LAVTEGTHSADKGSLPAARLVVATDVPAISPSAVALASWLADGFAKGDLRSATWLNHSSALHVLESQAGPLRSMDFIGIDGLLLRRILGEPHRTSADLVLPLLFPLLRSARIALIGGTEETNSAAASTLAEFLDDSSSIVLRKNGFEDLPTEAEMAALISRHGVNVVIVGLGAGLQEPFSAMCKGHMSKGLIVTCGGFLDQVHNGTYYPRWAYPLHLNWLVRLAREPKRLYRRYTFEALSACRHRRALRHAVLELPGYQDLTSMVEGSAE